MRVNTLRTLTGALVLLAGSWVATPAKAQDLETVVLNVRGMWAGICEWYVEEFLLDGLDGVEKAEADHEDDTVTIVFDPAETSPERLAAAIEECPFFRVNGSETHDLDRAAPSTSRGGETHDRDAAIIVNKPPERLSLLSSGARY